MSTAVPTKNTMRKLRAKSMNAKRRRYKSSSSDENENEEFNSTYFENEEENCEHDEGPPKSDDEWSAGDQLHLLRCVRQQIPQTDALPFEERVQKIQWKKVQVANKSIEDVQSEFQKILQSSRQFRLLNEIVREKQEEILPKLSVSKPLPAFILFMRDNKDKIIGDIGDKMQVGKYTQIASELFKKCSEKERDRYRDMAAELKKKYKEDLAKYDLMDITRPVSSKGIKTSASFKDAPIDLFIRTQKLQGINLTKFVARKQYGSLDKTKKLELLLQWLGLQKGEKRNMEQYTKCKMILSKEERKIFDEYEGKPKKSSGYNLFMGDTFAKADRAEFSSRSIIKSAAQSWKNLPKAEREEYVTKANMSRQRFTANVIRFITSLPKDRQDYEISLLSKEKSKIVKNIEKTVKKENNSEITESEIEQNFESDLDDSQTILQDDKKRKKLSKSLSSKKRKVIVSHVNDSDQSPARQTLNPSTSKPIVKKSRAKKSFSKLSLSPVESLQNQSDENHLNSAQNIDTDLEEDENERIYQCQTAHSPPRIDESDGVTQKAKRKELSKSIASPEIFTSPKKQLSSDNSNEWPSSRIFTQIPKSHITQFDKNTKLSKLSLNRIDLPILHVEIKPDVDSALADTENVKNVQSQIFNSPQETDQSDNSMMKIKTKSLSSEISSRHKKRVEDSDQSPASENLNQSFLKHKHKKRKFNENVTPSKSSHKSFAASTPVELPQKESTISPSDRNFLISPIASKIRTETREKYEKLLAKRPPDDIIEYYAQQIFNGSRKKATKNFIRMSESEKDELDTQFQKSIHKYKKKLNKFTESLKPSEQTAIKAHLETMSFKQE